MIEVFKTNVTDERTARVIVDDLKLVFPDARANFDLEDCDKILKIAPSVEAIDPVKVIDVVREYGYTIEVLE